MRFLLAAALSAAVVGAALPGAALADPAPAPKAAAAQDAAPAKPRMTAEERFKAANTTGDGRLTYAQAQAKMPRVAHDFEAIDKDRKGYVTLDDIRAHDAERRRARKAEKAAKAADTAGQHSAQAAATTRAN